MKKKKVLFFKNLKRFICEQTFDCLVADKDRKEKSNKQNNLFFMKPVENKLKWKEKTKKVEPKTAELMINLLKNFLSSEYNSINRWINSQKSDKRKYKRCIKLNDVLLQYFEKVGYKDQVISFEYLEKTYSITLGIKKDKGKLPTSKDYQITILKSESYIS